jgi:hypothetical protein
VLLGRAKLPADLMEGMFIALEQQALGQVKNSLAKLLNMHITGAS